MSGTYVIDQCPRSINRHSTKNRLGLNVFLDDR